MNLEALPARWSSQAVTLRSSITQNLLRYCSADSNVADATGHIFLQPIRGLKHHGYDHYIATR